MPTKNPRMALVIDEEVKEKITWLASKHRRSTSSEIVTAIEYWVKAHEEEMADFQEGTMTVRIPGAASKK